MSLKHAHAHGHAERAHGAERGDLTRRAAIASITMALCLILLKIWASWETGSWLRSRKRRSTMKCLRWCSPPRGRCTALCCWRV